MRRWTPLKLAPRAVSFATIASAARWTRGEGRRFRATSSISSVCDLSTWEPGLGPKAQQDHTTGKTEALTGGQCRSARRRPRPLAPQSNIRLQVAESGNMHIGDATALETVGLRVGL